MASEDDGDRQAYSKLYQRQVALCNLREAMKQQDFESLHECLDECHSSRVKRTNATYSQGRRTNRLIIKLEKQLDEAVDSEKPDELEWAISQIHVSGIEKYLEGKMEAAKEILASLVGPASPRFRKPTIGMTRSAMSEIRKYYRPSPLAHRVMVATLLLLGESEEDTQNWSYIQQKCFPTKLERRMLEFDQESLDELIIERAQYLLSRASLQKIRKSCPGVACFYMWTRDMIGGESDDEGEEEEEERKRKELKEMEARLRDESRKLDPSEVQRMQKYVRRNKQILENAREKRKKEEKEKLAEAIKCEKVIFPKIQNERSKNMQQDSDNSSSRCPSYLCY